MSRVRGSLGIARPVDVVFDVVADATSRATTPP